jgi:AcrR family transcriptional regulator
MGKSANKRKAEWDRMMKKFIYDATMVVLRTHGFDGLRMDMVAKAAEVATGTLYNYFKDKDELLLHVIKTRFDPIHQDLLKIRDSRMSPPKKIERFIRATLDFLGEYQSLVIIVTTAEGLSMPVKTGANQKREIVHKIFAEIVDEGIEQGLFRQLESMRVARLVFGGLNGLVQAKSSSNDKLQTVEEKLSDCLSLFLSGLLAQV